MGQWRGVELAGITLSGRDLTLRPFRPADVPFMLESLQARYLHEFVVLPDPYTPADAEQYVLEIAQTGRAAGTSMEFAVVENATDRLVGACSLRLPAPRSVGAEIGYAIYPAGVGHGYAAQATRLLADWGFAHALPRLQLRAAVGNLASIRTALNAGFHFEGIERDGVPTPSGPADGAVFSRTPVDSGQAVAPTFAPLPPDGVSDGSLAVRVARASDAEAIYREHHDAESMRWSLTGVARSEAAAKEEAERAALNWLVGRNGLLVMQDVASGSVVGTVQLRLPGPPGVAGIGYTVLPEWRGRGFTARALRLITAWAFGDGGFERLELGANRANIASLRAARSGGFVEEGVRRARLRTPDGTYGDEVAFGLVRPL